MTTSATALPLVYLPGIDGTRQLRVDILSRLARDRDTILIDYPIAAPAAYDELYGWLLPRLPDGPFVVLGESYSGPIATLIASRLGERVRGLILAVTFVAPPLPGLFRLITGAFGTGFLPHIATDWILHNRAGGTVAARLHEAIDRVPAAVIDARAMAALTFDARTALSSVRAPILSLEARRDHLILGHCSRTIRTVQPTRQHVVIDGPHMILETNVEDCARAIDAFCCGLQAPKTQDSGAAEG